MKNSLLYILSSISICLVSCNDFLDREPLDKITPEIYFSTSEQLGAYSIGQYENFNASTGGGYNLGVFKIDDNTDTQTATAGDQDRWVPGILKVSDGDGGWTFDKIYKINYFFDNVLPKYEKGEISGSDGDIKHYIGEMYFLRAKEYFDKVKRFGDFPIIKHVLPLSDKQGLIDANRRYPMNEVGRFILCDLDSAAMLMGNSAPDDSKRNRLTRDAALLFKSRVALYLGSWLQNFKGTAFVPGGKGWPGEKKEYNKEFSIDIDKEIEFFLTEAMTSAKDIAERIPLERNNQSDYHTSSNPYVLMYTDKDLSSYQEVLFWRATSLISGGLGYGWAHNKGGSGTGYTKGFINSFLCKDGLPIYASNLYKGDDNLVSVKTDRDNRLVQFMKGKDEVLSILSDGSYAYTPAPILLTTAEYKSVTGYDLKKGLTMSPDDKTGPIQESGIIEYRAAEAYLNYIEACYLKNKNIDSYAEKYWIAIRERAGIDTDFRKTIQATDMNKETGLLSAYTAGKLVDATLYNIRRERSCELMSEGFRWDDLRRWRSMDQIINNKFVVEGFKLWGEMKTWYNDSDGKTLLIYEGDGSSKGANVSSPVLSEYLRPYQVIHENNNLYDGYGWLAANYLSPIGMSQFNITSNTNNGGLDYAVSPLYQNPGWPTVAGGSAENVEGF
ncbi:MAG: RagB/SusD family nutrient uptake outer membrane protein [Parabacteroides sp.]|nr:RagB/SusD family nutrient uptake outer membrane protein [Parabacteroides sp.]